MIELVFTGSKLGAGSQIILKRRNVSTDKTNSWIKLKISLLIKIMLFGRPVGFIFMVYICINWDSPDLTAGG